MAMTLHERNIFPTPSPTAGSACTRFHLPASGILVLGGNVTTTLTELAVYQPLCTDPASMITNVNITDEDALQVDLPNPFYASASPQFYAIATATVISWMLMIMLLITPRTFFLGGPGGGRLLGRRNILSGGLGSAGSVGVGGRPWLQKVATLLVAISLTLASAEIFRITSEQYAQGFQDAQAISDHIGDSWAIKILSIISKTFLWLAQVQTLIRLFPRHKEKVSIKWLGFALIVLDFVFAVLQDVAIPDAGDDEPDDDATTSALSRTQRKSFTQAIPALSYLFSLALSFLYAAAVMYYSLEKRRYAFFHPKMRNICLVALISLLAISIPIVFFVLDIANPQIANWGDYMRWVGAASASVVVWEWVERIEALERDERRNGILGREVFDGDDMLDPTPSKELGWPSRSGSGTRSGTRSRSDSPGRFPGGRRRHAVIRHGHSTHLATRALGPNPLATISPDHRSSTAARSAPPTSLPSPDLRTETTTPGSQSTDHATRHETTSLSTTPGHDVALSLFDSHTAYGPGTLGIAATTAAQPSADPPSERQPRADEASHAPASAPSLASRLPFRFPFALSSLSFHHSARRPGGPPTAISRAVTSPTSPPTRPPESEPPPATTIIPTAPAEDEEPVRPSLLGRLHLRRNSRPSNVALPVVVVPMQPRGMVWTPPIESTTGPGREAGTARSNEEE